MADVSDLAKQTLKQVGETMFPGISFSYNNNNGNNNVVQRVGMGKAPEHRLGHEIVSSLPMQVRATG